MIVTKGLAIATDEITTNIRNGHHLLVTPSRCNRSLVIPRCRVFRGCDKRRGTMRYSPMAGWLAGGPSKVTSSETFFSLRKGGHGDHAGISDTDRIRRRRFV